MSGKLLLVNASRLNWNSQEDQEARLRLFRTFMHFPKAILFSSISQT
jgi:hypothetical protein